MLSDPYVRPETDHFVTDMSGFHSKVALRVTDYKVYRRYALAVPQNIFEISLLHSPGSACLLCCKHYHGKHRAFRSGEKMSGSKRLLTVCILGMILLIAAGCSRKPADTVETVQTLPAVKGSVRKVITFVGNVTSGQSSSLTWGTDGVIETVNVRIGDSVSEGQILATLAEDSLSSAVLNAEIPLINAQENLDEVLASETPKAQAYKEMKDREAALVKAEKHQESLKYPHALAGDIMYWADQVEIYRKYYEDAQELLDGAIGWKNSPDETYYNLYETFRKNQLTALNNYSEVYNNYLYYSGKATQNDFDQAAADIDVAKSEYEKAMKNFMTYYSEYPRTKDVAAAELTLKNAQDTYNRRNIVADINGVVTSIRAREGDYVTQGTAAFQLDNKVRLYVPMDVPEIDVVNIQDGMQALVVLDADTDKVYDGVVTTISASGEESGNRVTFGTVVEILAPDDSVKIGMTAEVDLVLEKSENALLVPANAVFSDNGNTYVAIRSDGESNDVPVKVGIVTETVAEITGGFLKEGDEVIVPSIDSSILKDMGLNGSRETIEEEGLLIGGGPALNREGFSGMPQVPGNDQAVN